MPAKQGNFFRHTLPLVCITSKQAENCGCPIQLSLTYILFILTLVKDISLDIFNEFRDYFEEDSEREKLKKRGLDIDNIPRRTSNILARFQEGLKVSLYCTFA